MTATRLLLVSPAFHGYWRSIQAALEQLGYDVTACLYDEHATLADKARNKLSFELPTRFGLDGQSARVNHATNRAAEAVEAVRPAVTVVIKGDVLDHRFWDALDRVGSRRLLWLYDELRRTSWDDTGLGRVGLIASYSHADVATLTERGLVAHHLPLAFDAERPYLPVPSPEVVFVGARYPNREQALIALRQAGVPVRAFGRDWSKHPADRLRTWTWSRPGIPAGRDVSLEHAYGLMAGAAATVNIHGDQDGFTMRTFEASGVGGVQLIDRHEVSAFYNPGEEVAVFSGVDELAELARRAMTDATWSRHLRAAARRRTLAHHTFVDRMQEAQPWWD